MTNQQTTYRLLVVALGALMLVGCGEGGEEEKTREEQAISDWLTCGLRYETESPGWETCVEPYDWAVRQAPGG